VKVAVIGGSGFLGSSVADELTKRKHEVFILDNTPSPWLQQNQNFIEIDILNTDSLNTSLRNIDYVYHFAGIADIGKSKEKPLETLHLNILGPANVAEACIKNDIKRLIFASSLYVFNKKGSFYGTSKRAAELLIKNYHEEFNLDFNFLRYGSLYGPRAQKWNGINRYIDEVMTSGKLSYPGKGNEVREYIHVNDAARLSVDILKEEFKNQALTISGTQTLNSSELIKMIFEISGKEEKVEMLGSSGSDHYQITPYSYSPLSSKKITSTIFKDLGEGILDIIKQYDKE